MGCNIVLMKRFLPLLIFTGLLFGQDGLILKSGESFEGTFYGKVGEDIVFKIEGETSTKKYSINDVNTIVTKNGELTYPFGILTNKIRKLPEGVGGLICIGSCYMIMQLYAWLEATGEIRNKGKGHRS